MTKQERSATSRARAGAKYGYFSGWRMGIVAPAILLLPAACSDVTGTGGGGGGSDLNLDCSINTSFVFSGGVPRDGIPALTDPPFVSRDSPDADYLNQNDRVIGLIVGGQPIAVPHNILWWHEIVNLNAGEEQLAITYCPLTGSTVVFDRSAIGGAEFGVSGLLFQNNLMMHDRRQESSLWPQMSRGARCGVADGTALPTFAALDITWQGWQELYPETQVVSGSLGLNRNYRLYPYGNYEGEAAFFRPMPFQDGRLFNKARVLGLPGEGGTPLAFPLAIPDELELWRVSEPFQYKEAAAIVFWDQNKRTAVALRPVVDGVPLDFEIGMGGIFDVQTGSRWSVAGQALDGPMAGRKLEIVPEAYVAFWGAWAVFEPEGRVWPSI